MPTSQQKSYPQCKKKDRGGACIGGGGGRIIRCIILVGIYAGGPISGEAYKR